MTYKYQYGEHIYAAGYRSDAVVVFSRDEVCATRYVSLGDFLNGDLVITIRRLQCGEADHFKQIRLTSLQDAPYAFSSNHESALQRSVESWREQADSTTQGSDRATFIAFSEDVPIGIAALYRLEGQADTGEALQVWVSPAYRGTSVARDLVDVIIKWASENYFRRITARVTKVNARALKFYANCGFSVLDESSPSDSDGVYLVKEVKRE